MRHSLALLLLGIVSFSTPASAQAPERYATAVIDLSGTLRIRTTAGKEIVPPRDTDQVGFDQVLIAPDRSAVGWLAMYPNCCTSYPIPLKLLVLREGRIRTFTGNELPVWQWRFEADGRQVAFYQVTVHGGSGEHYELRDLATGRLVAHFEPADSIKAPAWVDSLLAP